jgi:PAS domain S-box-containing protein
MRRTPKILKVHVNRAVVWLFVGVFLLLLPAAVPAQSDNTKRILVLYWYSRDWPSNVTVEKNVLDVFNSVGPPGSIEYYPEYLETNRFPGDDQESILHDYLKQKYAHKHIDAIIASPDTPLRFLLKYRNDIFPNVPVVFSAVESPAAREFETGGGLTGVINTFSFRQTLELALSLQPDTKQVFVVSGSPEHDKIHEKIAREQLQGFGSRVLITYLTDLSPRELVERTKALPDHSIILYAWQQAYDENGKLLESIDILPLVAAAAKVPIYGLASWQVGKGVVGGYVRNNSQTGTRVAEMAVEIANGTPPRNIPVEITAVIPMFDAGQLKRWGISEQKLPVGNIVEFKQRTFWQEDKWYVIGTSTAILAEGALIAFLLITLRRERLAERERKRLTTVAESTHRRLDEIVSNVPGIVWESMVDPLTNVRETTFISDHVQKMLGYTPAEWLTQPAGFGASIVHEDDRERVLQESEEVLASGHIGFSQFRWLAKDGRTVWTENYLCPIANDAGKIMGLRGVAIDISDRKQAEETVRVTQAKDQAILDAVPDLLFLHSPDGQYLDFHCKHERDLFAPPEKFLGKNVRDVLPAEVAEKLLFGYRHVKEGVEPYVLEYELPINGSHRWFEARMVPSAGNILTVVRDVTARRQAEESLRVTEEKDRAILEAIPDLMFVQTRDGVYLDHHCSNPNDLLVPPESFMGKSMHEVLPPELAGAFSQAFQRAFETRETQVVEYELALQGEPRWFEARIVSSGDNILSVIRDITQRVFSEAAIKRSEAQLAGVIGSAMDGIITIDEHQRIVLFNESAEKVFGWPAAEAIGQSLDQFIPARYREHHRQHLQGFGAEKINRRMMGERGTELFGLRRSGEEFPMEASISQIELHGKRLYTVILRDVTDRKLAEAALKESELNYRTIFNAATDAIFVIDFKSGRFIDVNDRMCEMYGCTQDQAKTLWIADVSSNEAPYTEKEGAALIEKAAAGIPQTYEWRTKRLNGELFWVECSLRHMWLRGKECLLAVVRDITERKAGEDLLAESHRHVTEILESIGDAFYSLDSDFRFTYVNRKTEEVWAMPRQNLIGRNFLEVFPQAIGSYSHQECMRAIAEAVPINFEAVSPILNRWLDTSVYPTPSGLSVYFRDVTERKQAAEALRESESRLRRAQEAARVGTWELDIPTGEVLWSAMVWQFLGLEPENGHATIERFSEFIHPEDRERAWHSMNRAIEDGDLADEFRIVRTNGEVLWLAAKARVIRSANGRAERMIGVNIDVTDQHRALDELRESEERFAKAFRANPQPMSLTCLASGKYLDVNDSFLQMSGYTRDQVIGKTSLELNIWGSPEAREEFVTDLKERGSLVNRETRFYVSDGSARTLLSSAERLEIDGKQCLLVASSDITERMLAQRALVESEARFRNMADTAPVMIWIADINKNATYFNQQWLEFTGRPLQQEIGNGWTNGIHPLDLDGSMKLFDAAFDSREPFRMEYRLRRADGSYRWVIDSGTPRLSSTGEFLGYIGSSVDITDRKESEAALVFAHEALENAYGEVNQLKAQLQEENIYLQEEIKLQQNFGEIVGASDALKYVLFKIEQVAPTDSTVLITGETGTGKELVARAIHTASTRRDRPMVKVNCAALSASLIESELFGHEKGSFTGALARKIGRFELADGATLFLDEIGELPLELQVKLLRVIQEGEFERLGSSKTVKVDVRIIAATNRNLKEQVNKGLFREDLWYRLNVFPITVPPLRQRRDDIPMLIDHFANTFSRKLGKEINSVAPATINALRNYAWPGNVRELANVIERAVINTHGPVLRVREQLQTANGDGSQTTVASTLEEVERDYIIRVLEDRGWRIEGPQGAAHVLGMNPSTLRTRIGKLGINKPSQQAARNGGN